MLEKGDIANFICITGCFVCLHQYRTFLLLRRSSSFLWFGCLVVDVFGLVGCLDAGLFGVLVA